MPSQNIWKVLKMSDEGDVQKLYPSGCSASCNHNFPDFKQPSCARMQGLVCCDAAWVSRFMFTQPNVLADKLIDSVKKL
jgi:hypothetical protein